MVRAWRPALVVLAAVTVAGGCALFGAGPVAPAGLMGPLEGAPMDLGAILAEFDAARRDRSRDGASESPRAEPGLARGERTLRSEPAPERAVARLRPRPRPGPFSMSISGARDFVSQATSHWCVAAAMQTMVNIMAPGRADRSERSQRRLYLLGRRHSNRQKLHAIGIEPEGWAEGLNARGYGPYVVYAAPGRAAAVRVAARALRLTGRPVGLVTWRGAHSWVMHGFEATADPAWDRDFQVTHVRVHDVWWPRISSIWGPSRGPDARLATRALAPDFLPFRRPGRRYPNRDGRFLLILPVAADESAATRPRASPAP